MALSKLEKPNWHAYFDNMSRLLDGKRVEVEVDALAIGGQVQAEWLPLIGITYDPKDDIVNVALEGLQHMIHKPREVFVDQTVVDLNSVEVIDTDDYRHIIKLRDPLMLSR
ncbi:MAG: hypothetical protein JWP36_1018 [Paucimonas sp.]|nr:hypothetical protein [Paucimonas sp.]